MNKDKLISLIIRKETYKDTKPFLNDLAAGKESAAKVSAEAVRDILTTDYIIEAKLYAVRYLKDAFEKGNSKFIELVENSILPILMGIAVDETDDKAIIKYAGSSYTKTQELTNFKSILSSVFRMAKQCIIKWGEWISDPNRKFISTVNELKKKNINLNFEFKYFREENQRLFRDFCKKNGVVFASSAGAKSPTVSVSQKKKDPLIQAVQASLLKVQRSKNKQEFTKLQNDFNEALNNYLQNAENFQDDLVQKWFDEFEQKKKQILKKLESGQSKSSKVSSSSIGVTPGQEKPKQPQKKSEKNGSVGQLELDSNKKIAQSLSPPKPQEKKKEEVSKSQKQVTFTDEQKSAMKSPKGSKQQIEAKQNQKQSAVKGSKQTEVIKQQKPSKVAKTKGPILFDDLEEEQVSKPPPKPQKPLQGSQKSETFGRSRPEALQNKPIKPTGQESRSPKGTEMSQSSKRVEESKSSKMSSQTKVKKGLRDEPKASAQKYQSELPKASTNILQDLQMSKDSERVSFSEQESQFSEDAPKPQEVVSPTGNFKKKTNLDAIEEQNYSNFTQNKSGVSVPLVRSKLTEEKASVANKLLLQNKHLSQKCDHLSKDFQKERQSRLLLDREKQKMQRELVLLRENQQKMIKKLKASVPLEDYNMLKQELEKEKMTQTQLFQENARLKAEHNSLIQQLNQTRNKMGNYSLQEKSKVGGHSRVDEPSQKSIKERGKESRNILNSQLLRQQIDEDYIRNMTAPSNIHNWLSEVNILLFKKNCLNLSEIFYRDDYLTILSKSSVYTQNFKQFLSLSFAFQFKSLKQVFPQAKYMNCQELDLWTKPLSGQEMLYNQELVVGLHRNPIKIMKGELKIVEGLLVRFLLPFMYVNFLREENFSSEQFQDIFMRKAEYLIKSKIITINPGIIKEPQDFRRIFKCAELTSNKVRFCLSEGISDCIFMTQIQLLRNSKALIRILPIPEKQDMTLKARELLDDLTFLIS